MRVWFCILLVIFSQVSFSWPQQSPSIGLGSTASIHEFRAYLKAHPQYVSLAEAAYEQSVSHQASETLFETFKTAQHIYFNDSKEKALDAFIKVLSLLNTAHWKPKQRKILFTSALRASELSNTEQKKQHFLNQALQISVTETPDPKVFPPPFIKKFDSFKQTTLKTLVIPESLKDAEIISVAGQVLRPPFNHKIKYPASPAQVVAYSSKWSTIDFHLNYEKFQDWSPPKNILFSENCSNVTPEKMKLHNVAQVYFHRNCVIDRAGKNRLRPSTPVDFQVTQPLPKPSVLNMTRAKAPAINNPWWKNKWIWIGVAGAGAAYMIYENEQSSRGSGSNPTTVYE